MKVPDLSDYHSASVNDWEGDTGPLENAARHAKLCLRSVSFAGINSKNALLEAFYRRLKLPQHFGHNWDALADCLMDEEWATESGYVIVWKHCQPFQHTHHEDFETAWEIFADAAEYWKEHKKPFWVFAA